DLISCSSRSGHRRYPHASPTRRSSDLRQHKRERKSRLVHHHGFSSAAAPRSAAARTTSGLRQSKVVLCVKAGFIACRHWPAPSRSEEHTSELQSRENLVCRLLLEKKKI